MEGDALYFNNLAVRSRGSLYGKHDYLVPFTYLCVLSLCTVYWYDEGSVDILHVILVKTFHMYGTNAIRTQYVT